MGALSGKPKPRRGGLFRLGLWRLCNIGTRSALTEHSTSNIHFWQSQVPPVVSLRLNNASSAATAGARALGAVSAEGTEMAPNSGDAAAGPAATPAAANQQRTHIA
jgi:hypothetical protein